MIGVCLCFVKIHTHPEQCISNWIALSSFLICLAFVFSFSLVISLQFLKLIKPHVDCLGLLLLNALLSTLFVLEFELLANKTQSSWTGSFELFQDITGVDMILNHFFDFFCSCKIKGCFPVLASYFNIRVMI